MSLQIRPRASLLRRRRRRRLSAGMSSLRIPQEEYSWNSFRELNKVYTNGTLVDAELLTDEQAGHCISIREDEIDADTNNHDGFGICVLDSATSEFKLSAFQDDVCRTKLETMMRQLRPKEIMYTKVSCSFLYRLGILIDLEPQGNLSVNTTRLLKAILPASCLWTSLRESEGFRYDRTIKELRTLYPTEEESMDADEQEDVLGSNVPQSIRDMLGCKSATEALGSMIWFVYFLSGGYYCV